MKTPQKQPKKPSHSIAPLRLISPSFRWALGDFANSVFSCAIATTFFPIFYKKYWAASLPLSESTYYFAIINSALGAGVFILAIFLGQWSDSPKEEHKSLRRNLFGLFTCTLIGAVATAALSLVPTGSWQTALFLFFVGGLGFWLGLIFYDALLPRVSSPETRAQTSALGYSLGYLSGGLMVIINAAMILTPQWFGFSSPIQGLQASVILVAIWWILFTLPLINLKKISSDPNILSINSSYETPRKQSSIKSTFKEIFANKSLFYFLIAYIFYIDGINTIIKMSTDFALNMGMSSRELIIAILIVQFVGFPATLGFSRLAQHWSEVTVLGIGVTAYLVLTILTPWMTTPSHFYGLAVFVGLVMGGVQAMSRSYYSRHIPKNKEGLYFGVYNTVGKFAAVLGPLTIGLLSLYVPIRFTLWGLIPYFIIGLCFLKVSLRFTR